VTHGNEDRTQQLRILYADVAAAFCDTEKESGLSRAHALSYDSSNTILSSNARSCKCAVSFTSSLRVDGECSRFCAVRATSCLLGWVPGLDWVQREFVTYDPRPADTLPARETGSAGCSPIFFWFT
jgi:hypothetical protein